MASLWLWRRARPTRISRPRTSSRPSRRGAPTSTGSDAMRVLIADQFEQSGRDELARLGCEVRFAPKLKEEALAAEVEQFRPDVLVVRSTKVPEDVLAAGALKLVVRAGAGYNTIDVAAASRRGIYVCNCPGKNSVAVAELAFGLILALDRQIPDNVLALRQGQWNKSGFSKARGLFGRTLGLIGPGGKRGGGGVCCGERPVVLALGGGGRAP